MQPIVKDETTKDRVYKQLKEAFLRGEISPNDIFTEAKLAELLNTSRTPVREAVLDLLKEGLVVAIPRKGLQVRTLTLIEQEQILLLRRSIEIDVIQKVASNITDDQILILKNIADKQFECINSLDNLTFIDLDQRFHLSLVQFLDFNLIEQVLLNLHELTRLVGLKALKKPGRMEEVIEEHKRIIAALETKNTELAGKYMGEHLYATWGSL